MGASLYPPPQATATVVTSGFTPTSGFTVNNFEARKINGVCSFGLDLAVVTTISKGSGPPWNIADTVAGNLPSGYRPNRTITAIFGTGFADGEADITAAGDITLRSTNSYDISAGETVRISGSWVL
ncbi:hypothetical protein ACIPX0_26325 [Streptomyces sp. NPDC090075]|uniref:hypothetical protein n=1 Tax=Streptomyces sp. NPDC090075 TaxID=3365937 RepID=UPI00382871AA